MGPDNGVNGASGAPDGMILGTTLATTFEPGTNRKGRVTGANWTFLLPRRDPEAIGCIGVPPAPALLALAELGGRVIVVCPSPRQQVAATELLRRYRLENVAALTAAPGAPLPLADRQLDVVVVVPGNGSRWLESLAEWPAELRRILKPDGWVYLEAGGPGAGRGGEPLMSAWLEAAGAGRRYWLTPLVGEMHTAVPLEDAGTIEFFLHQGLDSASVQRPPLAQAERLLARRHRVPFGCGRLARRYGALVGGAAADQDGRPPEYLRAIARQAGVSIDDCRWGLSASGQYGSRKVLFFLFQGREEVPRYVVKLTRDPAFNARLENEHRALTWLAERGIGAAETLPRPAFFGYHAGGVVLGQTAIHGDAFLRHTQATADCPYARAAIEWFIDLGAATADHHAATPAAVADCLQTLYDRFIRLYRLTPAQEQRLAGLIEASGRSPDALPLVFQHGDPGTWNALVTASGRVAFIDWEAAEPHGLPLWDLFYFLRALSVRSARRRGTRNRLRGIEQELLAWTPLARRVVASVERYRERTGVPAAWVEPLFYTCWMHRALKEATRLAPGALDQGHYVRLLRLCLDRRDAPTLRRLFGQG
jgi:SAM-dependent methyltransferase